MRGVPKEFLWRKGHKGRKKQEEGRKGADRAGLGAGSDGKGGVEVNSRISRPGFRAKVE